MRFEASLPAFRRALSDTIEALNTGIWRTRDGVIINRIPSRHDFKKKRTKAVLDKLVDGVLKLRSTYDELLRQKEITSQDERNSDSLAFSVSDKAMRSLETVRDELLRDLRRLDRDFSP